MDATVRATCPRCKTPLRIPAQWVGQAVKCKKCGAVVRSKKPVDSPAPDDTATAAPLGPGMQPITPLPPQPNAFDFSQPADDDDGLFQLPAANPAPAPAPAPQPLPFPAPPALDANGYPIPSAYPYPVPPGYPAPPAGAYPVPPGYPNAPPPGYAAPPGYPYPAPPGYPQPTQHGYALPPGYPHPQVAPVPAAAQPIAPPAAQQPTRAPAPVPPSNEFKMDPVDSAAAAPRSTHARYRRSTGKSKLVWVGVCLCMTMALIIGGVFGAKYLNNNFGTKEKDKDAPPVAGDPGAQPGGTPGDPKKVAFPRRLLFISVTKYMYLNPLTASQPGTADKSETFAARISFDWRIPPAPDNNQVFVLSDTARGTLDKMPMKNVVQGTYQEFFKTTRGQDRIVIYFGGHAIEKDGKAYLAPMEGELEGEDWEKTLIPLEHFYGELQKVKAAQKVVIWDVCRFNPEKGRNRPGSEPMTEALAKALSAAPPGVQIITTCSANENALEFNALRPDGFGGATYSGSVFLESLKFVGEKSKVPVAKAPTPADPIPVAEWHQAIAKRAAEMIELASAAGVGGGKQTVTLTGSAPATSTPPDPAEKVAARFEFPNPPKGASQVEIKGVEREFALPPLKPDLGDTGLGEFPFAADVMKDYKDDVPLDEVMKNKEKYKLRLTVLEALDKLREKWTSGSGTTKIRQTVEGAVNDNLKNEVKKEQEFWAVGIAELELQLIALETMAPMRDAEPKRWQAHYDLALASVKARLAYMNEYNKVLGLLITDTIPALDPKLGQDGYTLVASETLKSGKDVKKMAEEAKELFEKIIVTHKGTPWAIQAKRDKSVAIGLAWKPASLKTTKD